MNEPEEIAIMYSGGTDSTCAAAILAEKYERIHLLTFKRLGIYSVKNTEANVNILRERFPKTEFMHKIIEIDRLARFINYNNFFSDIFKYGLFTLSNCVVCCLVNHFGILVYCLENNIKNVADGSTRDWSFFPSHMEKVILLFRQMYVKFGIEYHTPVYDFDTPAPIEFIDKIYADKKLATEPKVTQQHKNTTGNYLYKLGIFPSSNIKGTSRDHEMQPRCMQFILHHIYIYWYFMALHDYSDFEEITLRFIKEKQDNFIKLTETEFSRLKEFVSVE